MKEEIFQVTSEQDGERLDKLLSIIYPDFFPFFFSKTD